MAEATLRKFISVVPDEEGKKSGAFAATTSVNRMGHAITGIGKSFLQVNELIKFQNEWILGVKDKEIERIDDQYKKEKDDEAEAEKKKKKRANLAKDLSSEKLQADGKKLGVKLFKKDKKDKRKWGWAESLLKAMSPIFNAIQWFAQTVITYVVFKWLGDPKNKENIEKFLKFISSLAKFAWWLTENSVGLLMDGVTKTFSWDPSKSTIENTFESLFGALQILGGLAGIWAVSRLLMPWKILSDVKAMMALGTAVTAAEASGCGPRGRRIKPKGPDGKPRFDPAEVRRRRDNIRRIRRNRRLARLYKKLSALQEAGAKLVQQTASNTKALIEASQAALKAEIARLNKTIADRAAARALREAAAREAAQQASEKIVQQGTSAGAERVGSEIIQTITKEGSQEIGEKIVVKTQKEVVQEVIEAMKVEEIIPKGEIVEETGQTIAKKSRWGGIVSWLNDTKNKTVDIAVAVADTTKRGFEIAGNFLWNQVIIPTGQKLNQLGTFIDDNTKGIRQSIANAPGKLLDVGNSIGKGLADTWKNFDEFIKNPDKLMEVIQNSMKGKIDNLVKQNPLIKNITDVAKNPKNINTLWDNMLANPILQEWKTLFLDGSADIASKTDAAKNIQMGPIDFIIDMAMAVFDYAYMGESPINAFAKAAGSFVGYGVGFTAASLIPGAQGWGSFLGGIAGAMLGEIAGKAIAQGIGKIAENTDFPGPGGLYNMRDPLAKAILGNKENVSLQKGSDGNPLTPNFEERPFLRHWDAAPFEFGNPAREGDAKGEPYSLFMDGGHVPDVQKPAFRMPAYMSMMDHMRKRTPYQMGKAAENIRGSEINITPMMAELSLRKVRRVKEIQMHTHIVAVTQPIIKTVHQKAAPPEIHYTSTNPHVSMYSK